MARPITEREARLYDAFVPDWPGELDFYRALAAEAMQRGASLVLITPNVKADWMEPLVQLAESDVTPTVLLFDPVSFGGLGSTAEADHLLTNHNIAHRIIQRELLDAAEIPPIAHGRWRWFTGRGKIAPARQTTEKGWRPLG